MLPALLDAPSNGLFDFSGKIWRENIKLLVHSTLLDKILTAR